MEEFIKTSIESYGLIAIFLLMVTNGFASAPPSEIVISLGGVFAAKTSHSLVSVIAAVCIGNFVGTFILYLLGVYIGYAWLTNFKSKHNSSTNKILSLIAGVIPNEEWLHTVADFFRHKGAIWVGIFRCFPMIRSIVSLPAGMAAMPKIRFICYSKLGIIIWAIFWASLGYWAVDFIDRFKTPLILFVLLLVLPCFFVIKANLVKFHESIISNYKSQQLHSPDGVKRGGADAEG